MRTENAIDSASPKSIRKGGIGRKRTARMPMIAAAKPTSRTERRSPAAISLAVAMSVMAASPPSETGLDLAVDFVGESEDLGPDERPGDGGHDQYDDDLRNEGQRDFLDLGQRLEEGDQNADRHRRTDRRAGRDDDRPDRRLDDRKGVGLVHLDISGR